MLSDGYDTYCGHLLDIVNGVNYMHLELPIDYCDCIVKEAPSDIEKFEA